MDVRQILARYALDVESVALLQDTWQAVLDAEMLETTTALRTRVFGSGRCLAFDQVQRCYVLRPFVELLLLELQTLADDTRYACATKERKAQVLIWEAGF